MGTEPRMRSLLSVSLLLLSFSFSSTSKLPSERNDGCTESSPFAIQNQSPKAKQPYLTLNVGDGSLSGGKLKKGKPRRNQIWTWLNCADGDFLTSRFLWEQSGKPMSAHCPSSSRPGERGTVTLTTAVLPHTTPSARMRGFKTS